MIISYREGLSGRWLAEFLLIDDKVPSVYYRQDIDGSNRPSSVFHYDGHIDSQSYDARLRYKNQKIITCHSTNYELMRDLWPDKKIIRIIPQTKIFQAIASAFYKLGPKKDVTIDHAFEYIKDYYNLHKHIDKIPKINNSDLIDFGELTEFDKLSKISKNVFNVELNGYHNIFFTKYWELQKIVVDEKLLYPNMTKENLLKIYSKIEDSFHIACFIFIYEKLNNLQENQRCWSIDSIPLNYNQLINLMKYNF
jgi:hypothetical protein